MTSPPSHRFAKLGFDDFRRLASDDSLSIYEKIGFPDSYRAGKERLIFEDIVAKLPALRRDGSTVLDIGPGCSEVPRLLIAHAEQHHQTLHLVDSSEMLDQLPDSASIRRTAAFFPECPELIESLSGRVDAIIIYSVLHYLFVETHLWRMLDLTWSLLAPGGHLLIGDIPNVSMRNRFFSSEAGRAFHREFMRTDENPKVDHLHVEADQIDDTVVFAILQRARAVGLHAYVLPQPADLPMSNRREDILIHRP